MSDGPLIVQSDRTVLLEVAHPDAEDARHDLAVFAELERAPEHIHTYRITRLGLWNARAAGHTAEDMLGTLETLLEVPDPADRHRSTSPRRSPATAASSSSATTRARCMLRSHRCRGAHRGRRAPSASRPLLLERRDDRHLRRRGLGARAAQAGAREARLAGRGPRRLHPGHAARDRARRGRLGAARLPAARRSTTSSTAAPASSCCPAARARRSSAPARWRRRRRPRSSSSPTRSRPASGATSCSSAPPSPRRRSASTRARSRRSGPSRSRPTRSSPPSGRASTRTSRCSTRSTGASWSTTRCTCCPRPCSS